uniref:Uncharacterized protein n=1 Tax=Candidatus Kentrum sp. LFY TaxID=2126342 RepID=A0A450U7J0_9GAMM|nr:MAG: hypothetical protein BECKLFY1418A_GA0070994_100242 [Candidatus Kentron sp. LFY]
MPLRVKFLKVLVFYPEQITSRPIPPDDERSRVETMKDRYRSWARNKQTSPIGLRVPAFADLQAEESFFTIPGPGFRQSLAE